MLSPIIIGVMLIIYVWFIDIEYYSTYYYCSTETACVDCNVLLGTDSTFCSKCGKAVGDIAGVRVYTHCDYCASTAIYRNDDKEFCSACGNRVTPGGTIKLKDLGFEKIDDFRKALMLDNVKKLLNSEIFISIIILFISIIGTKAIKGYLLNKLRKKIIKNGLDG